MNTTEKREMLKNKMVEMGVSTWLMESLLTQDVEELEKFIEQVEEKRERERENKKNLIKMENEERLRQENKLISMLFSIMERYNSSVLEDEFLTEEVKEFLLYDLEIAEESLKYDSYKKEVIRIIKDVIIEKIINYDMIDYFFDKEDIQLEILGRLE